MKIEFRTPSLAGNIYIGDDVIEKRLPDLLQGQKNFVLTDSNVYRLHRAFFEKWLQGEEIFVLPAGEEYKNFSSLQAIIEKMTGQVLDERLDYLPLKAALLAISAGFAPLCICAGLDVCKFRRLCFRWSIARSGERRRSTLQGLKTWSGHSISRWRF